MAAPGIASVTRRRLITHQFAYRHPRRRFRLAGVGDAGDHEHDKARHDLRLHALRSRTPAGKRPLRRRAAQMLLARPNDPIVRSGPHGPDQQFHTIGRKCVVSCVADRDAPGFRPRHAGYSRPVPDISRPPGLPWATQGFHPAGVNGSRPTAPTRPPVVPRSPAPAADCRRRVRGRG